jgi:hypothetical protein
VWCTNNVGEYEDQITSLLKIFKTYNKAFKFILKELEELPNNADYLKIDKDKSIFQYSIKGTVTELCIEVNKVE